jgi:hypothetical protein
MSEQPQKPVKKKRVMLWRPVDIIALILALSLGVTIVLILLVSAVQIIHGSFPQVNLSENATQVLIAGTGGLTGLLGAYIGLNRSGRKPPDE